MPTRAGHNRAFRDPAVLGLLGAVGIALLMWLYHWYVSNEPMVYPDSYQYMRHAFTLAGHSDPTGTAMSTWCYELHHGRLGPGDSDQCRQLLTNIDAVYGPRYTRMFWMRVGYPATLVPFVWLFGTAGVLAGTFVIFTSIGVVLYLAIRSFGCQIRTALLATWIFYMLPGGFESSRILSEGSATLGLVGAMLGAGLVLRGRTRAGAPLMAASLLYAYLSRPQTGVMLGGCLGVLAGFVWWRGRKTGGVPGAGTVALAGLGAAVALMAAGSLLGLPGIKDGLQLQFTDHYRLPDVPDPYNQLMRAEWLTFKMWVEHLTTRGQPTILALSGMVFLVRELRWTRGWPWLAIGLVALGSLFIYPDLDADWRYVQPLWIPVALGLALAATRAAGRRERGVPPARDGADPKPVERSPFTEPERQPAL